MILINQVRFGSRLHLVETMMAFSIGIDLMFFILRKVASVSVSNSKYISTLIKSVVACIQRMRKKERKTTFTRLKTQ